MTQKTWHEKLFRAEAVFHAAALACIAKAMLAPSGEAMQWITAAASVATLGRVVPTEKIDDVLSIPLVKPHQSDASE